MCGRVQWPPGHGLSDRLGEALDSPARLGGDCVGCVVADPCRDHRYPDCEPPEPFGDSCGVEPCARRRGGRPVELLRCPVHRRKRLRSRPQCRGDRRKRPEEWERKQVHALLRSEGLETALRYPDLAQRAARAVRDLDTRRLEELLSEFEGANQEMRELAEAATAGEFSTLAAECESEAA